MIFFNDLPLTTKAVFAALLLLSILTLTVTIFKFVQFRRLGVGGHKRGEEILEDWLNGRPDEAQRKAQSGKTVLSRVLGAVMAGLRARPSEPGYGEELARQVALAEMSRMGARMRLLEAVVQMAPMLGLLGTVIGMIDAFGNLALAQEATDPRLLASGIWTALTTTAAGLAIALIAYFIAAWLESRIEDERQTIELVISSAIHGRIAQPARA